MRTPWGRAPFRWIGSACLAALALGAGTVLIAAAAGASDGPGWVPWNAGTAGNNVRSDRELIREWEASPPKGYPTLSAENIAPTKAAIKRYTDIVAQGGWKPVPEMQMQMGTSDPAVAVLRERLTLSGDLKDGGSGEVYDYDLEKAVKRFQATNGLSPTGIVDKRTLAALNVPAQARLRQLKVNLTRLSEYSRNPGKKYVVVNIPAAQIEAVESEHVVSRHAGVVGKHDRQTPILRSSIQELNFNPVWTLPPTVIQQDLVPKGREMQQRNQSVLVKYGIDAYGGDGKKLDPAKLNWSGPLVRNLSYRQQPGPENPLGFVKINFNNNYSVYMHDTPSQSLFGRNFRAASSGCVRVHGIEQLAAWLVAEQGWSPERVLQMKKSGERLDVRLKKPIPLYFVYLTAWATEDGVVQFRRDLYEKDGVGEVANAY